MLKKTNEKGFTLIELVVVICIIGVLGAIIIPSILNYVHRAARRADIVTARLIGSTVIQLFIEYPEFEEAFYSGVKGGGNNRADYEVTIDGETYYYRNVARANGTKTNKNTQSGFDFYMNGLGWEQTDKNYNKCTELLNNRLDEIIGGNGEAMSYIPMRSTGYKHPASECNHDRGAVSSASRDKSDTYSYTDRWLLGYRIEKKGSRGGTVYDANMKGQVEVWAGDSYGRAANGPRVRLWPSPPSYY